MNLMKQLPPGVGAPADEEPAQSDELGLRRRVVLRVDRYAVVSRAMDRAAHADATRRGGYLLRMPGKLPEVVLDDLSCEAEQREAERRCLNQLAREAAGREATERLMELLLERRRHG